MTEQRQLYNKTIHLDDFQFLQVQVRVEKRSEITLKLSKKGNRSEIQTLRVFRFPREKVAFLSESVQEVTTELETREKIEAPLCELFLKFPRERVLEIFRDFKTEVIGKP